MIRYDARNVPSDLFERRRMFADLWGAFPNQSSREASYDFMTQTIELCKVDRDMWDAQANGDLSARLEVLPTLMHELTHWWDHIGTTWGVGLLLRQYHALRAHASRNESRFHEILPLSRELHRSMVPTYYTVYSEGWAVVPPDQRWTAEVSMGQQFDHRGHLDPTRYIPLITFRSPVTQDHCRFPFTVLTLLESRAVWFELMMELGLCREMPEEEAALQRALINQKFTSLLYDPFLVEYLACVHHTANTLQITEAAKAFKVSSTAAGLALNMPPSRFQDLRTPEGFGPWQERIPALKQSYDRGYAFLALLANAAEMEAEPTVNHLLRASGLPAADVLQEDVRQWVDTLDFEGNDELSRDFGRLRDAARPLTENWDWQSQSAHGEPPSPPIILSDKTLICPAKGPFAYDEALHLDRIKFLTRASRSMFEFQDACARA
jgi:hypothetical protein